MLASTISALLTSGIALLALGAVYWPQALGTFAASPGLPLILLAVLLAPFARPADMRLFRRLKLKRLLWVPVAGSAVSVVVFGWNPAFATKFVSLGLLSVVWLSPLLLADYLQIRHVRLAAKVGIVICSVAFVVSDLLHALPGFAQNALFGGDYLDIPDIRPRGFSEEASQFSATFSRLIVVSYLIWESTRRYNPNRLIGFLVGLAVLLVALGSKGAVSGIALAFLSFAVGRRQLPYLVLALPLAAWLGMQQLDAISVDLEQFSSTSTRITLTLTGLAASAANPLGWGYYGFYGAVQWFGGWALGWVSDQLPLLLYEARDIIEELNNVSTKSTLLDFTTVFGWFFVILMVDIVRAIRFGDPRVRACWVYVVTSSLSTSGHLSITLFLVLAVMLRLYPREALDVSRSPAGAVKPALPVSLA